MKLAGPFKIETKTDVITTANFPKTKFRKVTSRFRITANVDQALSFDQGKNSNPKNKQSEKCVREEMSLFLLLYIGILATRLGVA